MGKRIIFKGTQEIDYSVLALSSSAKIHRICSKCNTSFGLDFIRQEDLFLELKKGKASFAKAFSPLKDFDANLYLIRNSQDATSLLPEVKNADYLAVFKGLDQESARMQWKKNFLKLNEIMAAFPIEPDKLRNRFNLIFDDELF